MPRCILSVRSLVRRTRSVLHDTFPGLLEPPRDLDLEAVALGVHASQVEAAQGVRPEDAVPRGDVSDIRPQRPARVGVTRSRDGLPQPGPVADLPAGNPPGPDHEVCVLGEGEHRGQLGRIVRAVRIQFDDPFVAPLERDREAGQVRASEALLARAVQHADARIVGCEALCEFAGAIWAVVVHDHQVDVGKRLPDPPHDRLEPFRLVVGRNDHDRLRHAALSREDSRADQGDEPQAERRTIRSDGPGARQV